MIFRSCQILKEKRSVTYTHNTPTRLFHIYLFTYLRLLQDLENDTFRGAATPFLFLSTQNGIRQNKAKHHIARWITLANQLNSGGVRVFWSTAPVRYMLSDLHTAGILLSSAIAGWFSNGTFGDATILLCFLGGGVIAMEFSARTRNDYRFFRDHTVYRV